MRIKEFAIPRYGPSQNPKRVLNSFNLFFGRNEEGKTLAIDALVKLLLGRNIKDFDNIDRVDEDPGNSGGYVILEDNDGGEIKLPEKGNLTKITSLTMNECRNIFIIRNSDLSIKNESNFYTDFTDRLTGLRTKEIDKIKFSLREIGKITPKGDFRDIKEDNLKTKLEKAKTFVAEIVTLKKNIEENRFNESQEETVRLSEQISDINQRIENLDNASRREKYEKGKNALDVLKDSRQKLKNLEIYSSDDKELWWTQDKNIETCIKESEGLSRELREEENTLKQIGEELDKENIYFRTLDAKKKIIDGEIMPKIRNYSSNKESLGGREKERSFLKCLLILLGIFFCTSIFVSIFNKSVISIALSLLLSLVILSVIYFFRYIRYKAKAAKEFEEIKFALAKFELQDESFEKVLPNVQKFDEEHLRKKEELENIKRDEAIKKSKIGDLRNKIQDKDEKIEEANKIIDELKIKSRVVSLETYNKKLQEKQEYEVSIKEQRSILKSHFGDEPTSLEEKILKWEQQIDSLEVYRDKAQDLQYSEDEINRLKSKKDEIENKQKSLREKLYSFRKKMEDVEQQINEILYLDNEHLYCATSEDLETVENRLQEFISQAERNKDNALKVIGIFEEIEKEEKDKISELFGKDSYVSQYFSEITNSFYDEVYFDQEAQKIQIKCKKGIPLEAEKLSGGAYDQLYLSVRLALGEKLLKDKKGFFIMDDPFIKSDIHRLRKQIEMLIKIVESGWQIMYFSAKEEIKEALKTYIDSKKVKYFEIKSI